MIIKFNIRTILKILISFRLRYRPVTVFRHPLPTRERYRYRYLTVTVTLPLPYRYLTFTDRY
jgi:hypothetical protein